MPRTDPRATPRLYWVPETRDRAALREAVARATTEGFDEPIGLWLRFFDVSSRDAYDDILAMRAGCRAANVRIVVGGRLDLAIAVEADGVHLPSRGLSVGDARRLAPSAMRIGVSCHDEAELERAREADYVTISPVHPVPGKGPPLGFERLARLVSVAKPTVIALGGIREADVPRAVASGARGVAVSRAIRAGDEGASLRRFLRSLGESSIP